MSLFGGVLKKFVWDRLIYEWRKVGRAGHIFGGTGHTNDTES